jgi:spore coat protein H
MRQPWLVLALALAACGGGGDGGGAADAGGPDAFVDESTPFFDPDHVVQVDIELAEADWDVLRLQARSIGQIFGTCLMEPFDDPFTYFSSTVTIDGQRLDQVGVRKKGFLGSLDPDKPSLKLKFDEYVADQRFAGLENFTLNNSKQDPAFVRQCLAYRTFRAAGVPATRCNFARVTVNGRDLGLYVHVESGSEDFLRRHFADPEGNLYEGTLSDFREGWTATFELKTNETANDRRDLQPVVDALELPDDQLLAALEPLVDIDQFLTFWATEVLITHWDGYAGNANNFFAYHDPSTGKFSFMPWGADGTFVAADNPFGSSGTTSVQANSLLPRRLYLLPETRARYVAALRAVMARAWDEPALLAEIDRMEDLITPIADPQGALGLAGHLEQVRDFVRARRAAIEAELAPGPPAWTAALRDAPCFVPIGTLSGTFTTTWGTIGADDPFDTGTGTLAGALDDVALTTQQVGATSGLDLEADPARAQVAVVALQDDGTALVLAFQIDPASWAADSELAIDWNTVMGVVYRYTIATGNFELVGLFLGGAVQLDQASMTDGAPVTGSFAGDIIRSPF